MDRIACAYVPRYELALLARDDATVWQRPLAVLDVLARPGRLCAVTPAAERRGITAGQLATQARALCPELELRSPDSEAKAATERAVLTMLGTLAPRLDSDERGGFFLSLQGLDKLVPNEQVFAEKVRAALARLKLLAQVAVADQPFLAWVMAQRTRNVAVVPVGADLGFLESVPVAALGVSPRALELLTLLGVHSAAALLRLPVGALARRLGAEGVKLEAMCRGQAAMAWPRADKIPAAAERVELELDLPQSDLEPLLFTCKSLIDRLVKRLAHARLALSELTLQVRLDDRSRHTHVIALPKPSLDAAGLLELVRLWLSSCPFGASVATIELVASRTGAADLRQLSLLQQREEAAGDAMTRVVARLGAAFGPQAVVRPVLADSYRPEARLRWAPFEVTHRPPKAQRGRIDPQGYPGKVLRLVDPPAPVTWDTDSGWLSRPSQAPTRVLATQGPHRLAGEWWGAPFDRSYFWLWMTGGELVWVFRDERDGRVFLHAVVD